MTKPWGKYKSVIFRVYMEDGKTLDETRGIMETDHEFIASVRAYRAQFTKWNWTKYKKRRTFDADACVTPAAPVQAQGVSVLMTPAPSSKGTSGSTVMAESVPTNLAYQSSQTLSPYATQDGHRDSFDAAPSMSARPVYSLPLQGPVYNAQDQRMPHFQHDSAALAWQSHNHPSQHFQQHQQQYMPLYPNIQSQPTQQLHQHQQALQVNTHSSGALARMSTISPNSIPTQPGQGAYMGPDSPPEVSYSRRSSARSFTASRHPASGFEGQSQYLVSSRYAPPQPGSDMAPDRATYRTQADQSGWN